MSKIDELIHEYCPDGAEWKKLGDVCDTVTDYVAAGSFADLKKNVPYLATPDYALLVRTMDIKNGFTSSHPVYISESAFKYLWRVNLDRECIVLPNIGNCGEVYYIDPKKLPYKHNALATNAILLRSTEVMVRYLYYFFLTPLFQKQLEKITSKVGQGKFNKTDLKKLDIPVPPLPVQQEIVRILDSFTELQDELQKELEERKKQYTWLEEELITGPRYTVKKLSECATVERGKRLVRKQLSSDKNGGYPVYQNALEPLGYYSESNRRSNIPFVIAAGAAGKLGYSYTEFWAADDCYTIVNNRNVYGRYLYYAIEIQSKYLKDHVRMGSIPRIAKSFVEETQIFLPDYQQQVIIANKLDTLFQLIDKTIPSEIALRQQQYSYYRDKLLSFPRKEA